jgi:hypothetical protein
MTTIEETIENMQKELKRLQDLAGKGKVASSMVEKFNDELIGKTGFALKSMDVVAIDMDVTKAVPYEEAAKKE